MPPPIDNPTSRFDWRGLLGPISTGLGAFGSLFGGQQVGYPGKITTDQSTQSEGEQLIQQLLNFSRLINTSSLANQQQQVGSDTTPTYGPEAQQLLSRLTGAFSNLTQPPDLRGYQAQGLQDIGRSSDLQRQNVNEIMASRGLSTSPVAATAANNVESNRFSQMNQFNQSLPLLADEMRMRNLGAATNFFQAIPKGTTSTGFNLGSTSTAGQTSEASQQSGLTQGTTRQSGTSKTTQVNEKPPESTLGKILKGLGTGASIAASVIPFFSDENLKEDINVIDSATDKIMKLKPVEWEWNKDAKDLNLKGKSSGFVAQDIEKIFPSLVHKDKVSGYKTVSYHEMMPYLVGAVQELAKAQKGGRYVSR